MPELSLKNQKKNVEVKYIEEGHLFSDRDEHLYLRVDGGAVFLSDAADVAEYHPIQNSFLRDFGPYTDLGPLTIKTDA